MICVFFVLVANLHHFCLLTKRFVDILLPLCVIVLFLGVASQRWVAFGDGFSVVGTIGWFGKKPPLPLWAGRGGEVWIFMDAK